MKNLLEQHIKEQTTNESNIYVGLCYDFMDEVQHALKRKKWSQKDLADKMGKSPAEISKIINGVHNVTFKTISKLSDALDIDLIYTASKARKLYGNQITGELNVELSKPKVEIPNEYKDYSDIGQTVILKIGA